MGTMCAVCGVWGVCGVGRADIFDSGRREEGALPRSIRDPCSVCACKVLMNPRCFSQIAWVQG